jgi:transposase
MKLHANARSCLNSRALIARRVLVEGWALAAAAEAAGVSVVTARKWVRRAAAGESLEDRSSAPKRVPLRVSRGRVEAIAALRRLRMTAAEIAELLSMAVSTVSAWPKRIGLGRRSRLAPPEDDERDACQPEEDRIDRHHVVQDLPAGRSAVRIQHAQHQKTAVPVVFTVHPGQSEEVWKLPEEQDPEEDPCTDAE